ncbi:MAG: hypothetical protein BMS9Abin37_1383 [Acidobacteriota bacterium]|nr:MAG: hypothetical protein BMS9Abin37_1383 [Acidobacteriota bacterium]
MLSDSDASKRSRRVWLHACALAACAVLAAATEAPGQLKVEAPKRYFGNVPFTLNPTQGPSFTAQHLLEDTNLVVLHFDFWGIPWASFMADEPLPSAWVASMDAIQELRDELGLPVFLALTPIAGSRNGLAPEARGTDFLTLDEFFSPPCERIHDRPDADELRVAYGNYVDYMVGRFDPIFLAISIEVNLYAQYCPGAWDDMKALLNDVYETQKAEHPGLPVFNTFHIDSMWEAGESEDCFGFTTECLDANLIALRDLETDLFAISSYPLGPYDQNGASLPSYWISIFAERTGKPLAIAETGFQARSLTVENPATPGECFVGLPSSPGAQTRYLQQVLADAEALEMPFVTWWGNHDFIPQDFSQPCRCEVEHPWCDFLNSQSESDRLIGRFFSTIGLRTYQGTPRPALADWQRAVRAALE